MRRISQPNATDLAGNWLVEYMARRNWSAPRAEVFAAAAEAGHERNALYRAARHCIDSRKLPGFGAGSIWTYRQTTLPIDLDTYRSRDLSD